MSYPQFRAALWKTIPINSALKHKNASTQAGIFDNEIALFFMALLAQQ